MLITKSRISILSLALVTVGCAGGAAGPATGNTKGGVYPLTQQGTIQQSDLTTSVLNDMNSQAIPTDISGSNIFSGLNISFGAGAAASIYDSCTTKTYNVAGKDAAGVPYDFKATYACSNIRDSGYTYNWNGGYTMTSKATNAIDLYAGFTLDLAWVFSHQSDDGTNSENYKVQGSFESGVANSTLSYSGKYLSSGTNTNNGTSTQYITGSNYTYSWAAPTGTAAEDIYKQGNATFAGFYSVRINRTNDAETIVFKISSENLTYDSAACPSSYYKNGSITFTDAGGNQVTFTYTNCTQTKTFNGVAI